MRECHFTSFSLSLSLSLSFSISIESVKVKKVMFEGCHERVRAYKLLDNGLWDVVVKYEVTNIIKVTHGGINRLKRL